MFEQCADGGKAGYGGGGGGTRDRCWALVFASTISFISRLPPTVASCIREFADEDGG